MDKKEKSKKLTFKEFINISKWSFQVSWRISKTATIGRLVSEVLLGVDSFVSVYIMSKIIDKAISLIYFEGTDISDITPLLVILLIYSLMTMILKRIRRFSRRTMQLYRQSELERMRFEKLNELGVQALEDPEVNNMLQNAKSWIFNTPDVALGLMRILSALVKTVLTGIVLLNSIPVLVPILVVSAMISFYQNQKMFRTEFGWQTKENHLRRRRKQWWISDDLTNPVALSEISVIGAYKNLSDRYKKFFSYYNDGFKKIFKLDFITGVVVEIFESLIVFYGYIRTFALLLSRTISIGETTFYMSAIRSFHSGLSWFGTEIVFTRDMVIKLREVYDLFHLETKVKDGEYKLERFLTPPKVEFKDVTFRYPNTEVNVLENFNLVVVPGEKIAIVGANGAGKSTMVKLLCRLYDPQEGTILINGRDLKDIKINDWYKNIGALFQDYNFYEYLTAEDNIFLGKPMKEINKEKLVEAAKNAEAHEFIMKYKKKYKTIMSERFKGGIRPSNGQRQKIAIARFFYRNAPFAIFDEPTSAIDAQSEYRIFDRIYNFFGNKSVIIISHRFSTVRSADRILVLDEGKIVEEGNHKELLAKEGIYADSFKKQAEGYL